MKVIFYLHLHLRLARIPYVLQWILVDRRGKLIRCQFEEVWFKVIAHTYCYMHSLLWIIAFTKIYCLLRQHHFKTILDLQQNRPERPMFDFIEHCWQIQSAEAIHLEECVHVLHLVLKPHYWVESGTLNLISLSCDFFAGVCSLIFFKFYVWFFQQKNIYFLTEKQIR